MEGPRRMEGPRGKGPGPSSLLPREGAVFQCHSALEEGTLSS